MPLILRKIQKSKWYKSEAVRWLPDGELQADALADITTKGNRLSIYVIEDSQDDLDRVVTALAGTRQVITDIDYAVFDPKLLSDLAIDFEFNDGDTADDDVNKWHRELIELTTSKLLALTTVIKDNAIKGRVLSKRVRSLMVKALTSNQLDRNRLKLKPEILATLDQRVDLGE